MTIKTIDDLIAACEGNIGKFVGIGPLHGAGFNEGMQCAINMAQELKSHLDHYRWRKVEDELPKLDEEIECINKHGKFFIALFDHDFYESFSEMELDGITHWRYLDKPDESEE
jgi:hypothetical protein